MVGNEPINVKPREVGDCTTHGNLTVMYIPRVGILIKHHVFDLAISNSRREINHFFLLIIFDNFFAWGWGF